MDQPQESKASPGEVFPTPGTSLPTASPKSPQSAAANSEDRPAASGSKNGEDPDAESELSDPDSNVNSPPGVHELAETIMVNNRDEKDDLASPAPAPAENEDESMVDAPYHPKRKRTSLYNDLSESRIEASGEAAEETPSVPAQVARPSRGTMSSVKGVLIGHWRDSPVLDVDRKHAVIGFIDIRDRLRTRIQTFNLSGDNVSLEYPLPPGPGGSWVTFERVHFLPHLVGLDHFQVKEYVRIRSEIGTEATDEERNAGEAAAVKEAKERAANNPMYDNPATQPLRAYGAEVPDQFATSQRPDSKRRRTSGGFAPIHPAPMPGTPSESPLAPPGSATPTNGAFRSAVDPLPGTRPTRILLGYWKESSELNAQDRHAVYGILGQNDMFRVKLVRETRDGRFVDGNFPSGAGALWIAYEEVVFEPHLKDLSRQEIKEYCRVRQHQLDRGESSGQRVANETKAVFDAQARVSAGAGTARHINYAAPQYATTPTEDLEVLEQPNGRLGYGSQELRTSRRTEARLQQERVDGRSRQSVVEAESRPSTRGQPQGPGADPLSRTNALARREIARAEATQGRADLHAVHRERAAAAAADAANAAAANAAAASTNNVHANNMNGRARFHESEDMQRLNRVWARQESLRMKAGSEDAKMYDGIKYERKTTGPFMGKLVSQGTIISIDGEDYVEYRVLTKPSFF